MLWFENFFKPAVAPFASVAIAVSGGTGILICFNLKRNTPKALLHKRFKK